MENSSSGIQNSIEIKIFYDSMCGDSRFYFKNSLRNLYSKLEALQEMNIINLRIFPCALEQIDNFLMLSSNGDYTNFFCKHGENECYGNAIHACAILFMDNKSSFEFAFCYFDNIREFYSDVNQTTEFCLKKHFKEELKNKIFECAKGEGGKNQILEFLKLKESVNQRINMSPSIVINGSFNRELEEEMETDTLGYLCRHKYFSYNDDFYSKYENKKISDQNTSENLLCGIYKSDNYRLYQDNIDFFRKSKNFIETQEKILK